eukprot:6904880-Prymnesium_polylepis.1
MQAGRAEPAPTTKSAAHQQCWLCARFSFWRQRCAVSEFLRDSRTRPSAQRDAVHTADPRAGERAQRRQDDAHFRTKGAAVVAGARPCAARGDRVRQRRAIARLHARPAARPAKLSRRERASYAHNNMLCHVVHMHIRMCMCTYTNVAYIGDVYVLRRGRTLG